MAHSAGQSYGAKLGFYGRPTANADCRRYLLTIRARSLVREIPVSRGREFSAFGLDNNVTGRSLTSNFDGQRRKAPDPFYLAGVRAMSASRSGHATVLGDNAVTKASPGQRSAQRILPSNHRRQTGRRERCVVILSFCFSGIESK